MKINKIQKKLLYLFLFILVLGTIITLTAMYYGDRRGFIMGGNRLSLSTRREDENILIDINKKIVKSGAYKGIVEVAVSPQIPEGINMPQGFEYPVYNYEFIFTNSKNEVFTIKCPYWKHDYIVLFQVGVEQAYKIVWRAELF